MTAHDFACVSGAIITVSIEVIRVSIEVIREGTGWRVGGGERRCARCRNKSSGLDKLVTCLREISLRRKWNVLLKYD